jgi:hypothetical protein
VAVFGELDGVAHEVDEDLSQTHGVAADGHGHVGPDVGDELEPF